MYYSRNNVLSRHVFILCSASKSNILPTWQQPNKTSIPLWAPNKIHSRVQSYSAVIVDQCCSFHYESVSTLDRGSQWLECDMTLSSLFLCCLTEAVQTSRNAARSLRTCPCTSNRRLQHQTHAQGSSVNRARETEITTLSQCFLKSLKVNAELP